jgi:hypothetical protein
MRKFSAIMLLSLYLSVNIALHEWMRMPLLIEHFKEHRQVDGEVGFFAFLLLHYFGDDTGNADTEHHRQLPFKDIHRDPASLLLAIPFTPTWEVIGSYANKVVSRIHYKSVFNSAFSQFNIWQPPKF